MAGATKDDRLAMTTDLMSGEPNLLGSVDANEPMGHAGHVRLLLTDFVGDWLVLVAVGQDLDFLVKRCREQDGLPVLVRLIEDALHHREKPHVGHAIGLVDNGIRHMVKVDLALIDQVEKAARARHQHVDAALQRLELRAEPHASVDGVNFALASFSERLELTTNLLGEFPGGGQYEAGGFVRPGLFQTHDHRNAERQGLPRPCWGTAQDVLAGERIGNCRCLDRERRQNSGVIEALHDVVGNAECSKAHRFRTLR